MYEGHFTIAPLSPEILLRATFRNLFKVPPAQVRVLKQRGCKSSEFHFSINASHLEDVPPLVVLDGPPEPAQHGRDLLGAEQREQAVQQHLQLHCGRSVVSNTLLHKIDVMYPTWHRVEAAQDEAGDINDHPRRHSLQPNRSEQARTDSAVHSLQN